MIIIGVVGRVVQLAESIVIKEKGSANDAVFCPVVHGAFLVGVGADNVSVFGLFSC